MRYARLLALSTVCLALLLIPVAALAQGTSSRPTSGSDRLYLSFAEDATVIDGQWWEGALEYQNFDAVDLFILRGTVALGLWPDVEVGGTVGFGYSDPDFQSSGSGATDLDAWFKYYIGSQRDDTEFALSGVVTLPTGDDSEGLGFDAFALGLFGSVRHRLNKLVLSGNLGMRINGDGSVFGSPDRDGEVSPIFSFGVIAPIADKLSLIGETRFEGERFDGAQDEWQLLGGVNWRRGNRGRVRAAIGFGLKDGSPDWEIRGGYATTF